MTFKQGIILGVVLLVIALTGSAGIAYGVVELAGAEDDRLPAVESKQQSLADDMSNLKIRTLSLETWRQDYAVSSLPSRLDDTIEAFDRSNESVFRLTQLWAINIIAQLRPGETVKFDHPAVIACMNYILGANDSAVECDFQRSD